MSKLALRNEPLSEMHGIDSVRDLTGSVEIAANMDIKRLLGPGLIN